LSPNFLKKFESTNITNDLVFLKDHTKQKMDLDELKLMIDVLGENTKSLSKPKTGCIARIWKNSNGEAIGSLCGKKNKLGDFCGIHGKAYPQPKICGGNCKKTHIYKWEHLGRWDHKPPQWWNNAQWSGDSNSESTASSNSESTASSNSESTASSNSESIAVLIAKNASIVANNCVKKIEWLLSDIDVLDGVDKVKKTILEYQPDELAYLEEHLEEQKDHLDIFCEKIIQQSRVKKSLEAVDNLNIWGDDSDSDSD